MKYFIFIAAFILFTAMGSVAQSVGIGTSVPDGSAILDLNSSTKGLLIPRLTTRDRGSLVPAALGLMVFDTDTRSFWYNDQGWHEINLWMDDYGGNIYNRNSGKIGLGVINPKVELHLAENREVLFGADTAGAGSRFNWSPSKSAFRAGNISLSNNTFWNADSIGNYSVAFGLDTKATKDYSFAAGNYALATGNASVAMGYGVIASGDNSIALGSNNFGTLTASGRNSVAIGSSTEATGNYSVALGNRVHSLHTGSFVFGSNPYLGTYESNSNYQFVCGFHGGYKFYTGQQAINQILYTYGAELLPNASSWSTISDINKKEKMLPVNPEAILNKIKDFSLTTWNYKGLDEKTERHYGPMAQNFYAAFGSDALGTIGNDTTINEHDFSSINFIAIQALEKRTQKIELLEKENSALKTQLKELLKSLAVLQEAVGKLQEREKSR